MNKLPKLSVFLKHGFEYFVGGESKLLSEAEANEIIRRCEQYEKMRDALEEASHMIYGELYFDHPTVIKVKRALKEG